MEKIYLDGSLRNYSKLVAGRKIHLWIYLLRLERLQEQMKAKQIKTKIK